MKYIDEYRNKELVERISNKIHDIAALPCRIMEICGGQTHTLLKYNLEELLPTNISMLHGPGCPVCVTSAQFIDKAIELAKRPDVILTSFGDMLRVPGSNQESLLLAKANSADVRMCFSPLDAIKIAIENKNKTIVFFAVGFETTAPANARAVLEAKRLSLPNFKILCSQMLVPPAIEGLLGADGKLNGAINAILAAGHVCTVMGLREYEAISDKFHLPIVATGFEPVDIITGIYMAVRQINENRAITENQYSRVVNPDGNAHAINIINKVFEREDREWRGIGVIPGSGLKLHDEYAEFDALKNFEFESKKVLNDSTCIASEVLQGMSKPDACAAFGKECKPEHPLGAPMVSSEGACAAYYRYRRRF
jgi:hydrogenase expression/formation protein HypD